MSLNPKASEWKPSFTAKAFVPSFSVPPAQPAAAAAPPPTQPAQSAAAPAPAAAPGKK